MDDFEQVSELYEGRPAYSAEFFEKVVGTLKLGPHSSVLDLACGTGELTFGFSPHAGSVLGVDSSSAMLRLAEKTTAPNVAFQQWDLNQAVFDIDKTFDLVTISRAIHYLDPAMLEGTLSRSLANGGFVIVCNTGIYGPRTPWWDPMNKVIADFRPRMDQRTSDFTGIETMKSLSYPYFAKISGGYSAEYSLDKIVNHFLSYRWAKSSVLPRLEEFRRAANKALAPLDRQDGAYSTRIVIWANVFKSRERD